MELAEIATQLRDAPEKIILIYAFNATGKTRLSVEYKEATRAAPEGDAEKGAQTGVYYNAYSEDLFVWDNDIENGEQDVRLTIVESSLNKFHSEISEETLREKLAPYNFGFNFKFNLFEESDGENRLTGKKGAERGIKSISFFLDEEKSKNIKISRGEERVFIWCLFLTMFEIDGWAGNQSGHIFIDDPVSSLDDHNIFITALALFELVSDKFEDSKIVITTHHMGLYSILSNWIKSGKEKFTGKINGEDTELFDFLLLSRKDGGLILKSHKKDVLLYHLHLLQVLRRAADSDELYVYHFALLRQALEMISSFLGRGHFSYVLDKIGIENPDQAAKIINGRSHQKTYGYHTEAIDPQSEKPLFVDILNRLTDTYKFDLHLPASGASA